MQYYYKYQPQKKLSNKVTRMATVTVFTYNDKKIGCETVYKSQNPNDVVGMIIRDYELQKVWNSKQFSFNQ